MHTSNTLKRWLKAAVWMTLLGGIAYIFIKIVPMKLFIANSMTWIQTNPTIGAMVLPLVLTLAVLLCIPSPGVEILAGSMFGLVAGTLLCVLGKTIGQMIAFLTAKHFGKDRISEFLKTNFPTFATLATVLQSSSWKLLLLIQVANVPHLVKCCGLAIADISAYRFAASSAISGLPYAILWSYIGVYGNNLVTADLSGTSFRHHMVLGVGGTILTVLSIWWLVVYTKQQLHKELQRVQNVLYAKDTLITISTLENRIAGAQNGVLRPETLTTTRTAVC